MPDQNTSEQSVKLAEKCLDYLNFDVVACKKDYLPAVAEIIDAEISTLTRQRDELLKGCEANIGLLGQCKELLITAEDVINDFGSHKHLRVDMKECARSIDSAIKSLTELTEPKASK